MTIFPLKIYNESSRNHFFILVLFANTLVDFFKCIFNALLIMMWIFSMSNTSRFNIYGLNYSWNFEVMILHVFCLGEDIGWQLVNSNYRIHTISKESWKSNDYDYAEFPHPSLIIICRGTGLLEPHDQELDWRWW